MQVQRFPMELKESKIHGSFDFQFSIYEEKFEDGQGGFPTHWHPEYEIDYVLEGNIEIQIDDTRIILEAGDTIFLNSNQLHTIHKGKKNARILAILFSPNLFCSNMGSIFKKKYMDYFTDSFLVFKGYVFEETILEMHKNYEEKLYGYEWKVLSSIAMLYGEIVEKADLKFKSNFKSQVYSMIVEKIVKFIEKNYRTKISITAISKEVGLCKTEICRLFKKETGKTIVDFINEIRIEKSLLLLTEWEMNVTEIGQSVGFNSSSYYTEVFKNIMGTSPKEYRKKLKNNKFH